MIINRIYENENLLSLQFVSLLVGLRTYQHPCTEPLIICSRLLLRCFGQLSLNNLQPLNINGQSLNN